MSFDKGLNQDATPQMQPEGSYRSMTNGVVNKEYGAVLAELGTVATDVIGGGYVAIGDVILDDGTIILFAKATTFSQIILFDPSTDTITTLLDDTTWTNKLAFNATGISGEFKLNSANERIIYWTDDLNPPRFLNIDTIVSFSAEQPLDDFNLFPNVASIPAVALNAVNQVGGGLLTGIYQFAVAFIASDGTVTNYLTVSQPISINEDDSSLNYNNFDGAVNDTASGKSISLFISNIDTNYDRIRLAVIKDATTVSILTSIQIPISTTSLTTVYTGLETVTDGSIDEVLINNASYLTAKNIVQSENTLYMGNLTRRLDLDYQKYANAITVTPATQSIVGVYSDVTSATDLAQGYTLLICD